MSSLVITWYEWAGFLAVFIAAAATIYIFFDSQELSGDKVTYIKVSSVLGLLLTLPAIYLRFTADEQLLTALLSDPLQITATLEQLLSNMQLFAYLGLAGALLALFALIYYSTQKENLIGDDFGITVETTYASAPSPPPAVSPVPAPPTPAPAPRPARPVPPTQPIQQDLPATAWLVSRSGNNPGKQYGLQMNQPNIIGRDARRADIIIDDDTVSREHARIRYENGQFIIYDLASTSGTYINGNMVQRQMLYDNDRIALGRVEFVFKKA